MRHRKSAILDKWNEIADNRLKGSVYLALNRYVKDNYSYYVAVQYWLMKRITRRCCDMGDKWKFLNFNKYLVKYSAT